MIENFKNSLKHFGGRLLGGVIVIVVIFGGYTIFNGFSNMTSAALNISSEMEEKVTAGETPYTFTVDLSDAVGPDINFTLDYKDEKFVLNAEADGEKVTKNFSKEEVYSDADAKEFFDNFFFEVNQAFDAGIDHEESKTDTEYISEGTYSDQISKFKVTISKDGSKIILFDDSVTEEDTITLEMK